VITRLHLPDQKHRIARIIKRILGLPSEAAEALLEQTMLDFAGRHEDLGHIFELHLAVVKDYLPQGTMLSEVQKFLIGAYFTK
jgi:hypothetical protein